MQEWIHNSWESCRCECPHTLQCVNRTRNSTRLINRRCVPHYTSKSSVKKNLSICKKEFPGLGCTHFLKFGHFSSERKETESSGATESEVWIGDFNVKARKTIEHKLHKIWRSLKFCKISGKRAHPRVGWGEVPIPKSGSGLWVPTYYLAE